MPLVQGTTLGEPVFSPLKLLGQSRPKSGGGEICYLSGSRVTERWDPRRQVKQVVAPDVPDRGSAVCPLLPPAVRAGIPWVGVGKQVLGLLPWLLGGGKPSECFPTPYVERKGVTAQGSRGTPSRRTSRSDLRGLPGGSA